MSLRRAYDRDWTAICPVGSGVVDWPAAPQITPFISRQASGGIYPEVQKAWYALFYFKNGLI